jgi:hypothetical protein
MRYLLMICGDFSAELTPVEIEELTNAHMAFIAAAKSDGVYRSGEELEWSNTAATLRIRNGESLITDGPFAESKEQMGGFYVLDCKDRDEALRYAAMLHEAKEGAIEVRPIVEH